VADPEAWEAASLPSGQPLQEQIWRKNKVG
jgi:hypothetical protein